MKSPSMIYVILVLLIILQLISLVAAQNDAKCRTDPFEGAYSSYNLIPELYVSRSSETELFPVDQIQSFLPQLCASSANDEPVCEKLPIDLFHVKWVPNDPNSGLQPIVCYALLVTFLHRNSDTPLAVKTALQPTADLLANQKHIFCIQDCELTSSFIEETGDFSNKPGWTVFNDEFLSLVEQYNCFSPDHKCGELCATFDIPYDRFAFTLYAITPNNEIIYSHLFLNGSIPASTFPSNAIEYYPSTHYIIDAMKDTPKTLQIYHLVTCELQIVGRQSDTDLIIPDPIKIIYNEAAALIATAPFSSLIQFTYYDFSQRNGFMTPLPCDGIYAPLGEEYSCGPGVLDFTTACYFPELAAELPHEAYMSFVDPRCTYRIFRSVSMWNMVNSLQIDKASRFSSGKACVVYGPKCKNSITPDNKQQFFYKCRLHNTEMYSIEACESTVTFCPWPTCQFQKKGAFIPDFVTVVKNPKLHYTMPRDVQCFMRDTGVDVMIPMYICEETLEKAAIPETSYICDDDNTSSNPPTTTHSKCCLGYYFGDNCDKEPSFDNVNVYLGSLAENYLTIDKTTSHIPIPQLFSSHGVRNVTLTGNFISAPISASLLDFNSVSGLFTLAWEFTGPPTRFTFVYVQAFITVIQDQQEVPVALSPFPVLMARVPSAMGYHTFRLDQGDFANILNFGQVNQIREANGESTIGYADIKFFRFKLVSSAKFIYETELIPVTFGCRHKCLGNNSKCNIETGECICYDGYTSGSFCQYTLCEQITPRFTMNDYVQVDMGELTDSNWFPCRLSSYKWTKGEDYQSSPCTIIDSNGDTFTSKPGEPVETTSLSRSCVCELGILSTQFYTGPLPIPELESADSALCNKWEGCLIDYPNAECQNGGYHPYIFSPIYNDEQVCQEQCQCHGNWSPLDNCASCGLKCDHGKPNEGCTACICDTVKTYNPDEVIPPKAPIWFGAHCQCAIAMQVGVEFSSKPSDWDFIQDAFIVSVINDLISDTNIPFKYWFFNRDEVISITKNKITKNVFRLYFDLVQCDRDNFAGVINGLSQYYQDRPSLIPLSAEAHTNLSNLRDRVSKHLSFVYSNTQSLHKTDTSTANTSPFNLFHFMNSFDLTQHDEVFDIDTMYIQSSNDLQILQDNTVNTNTKDDLYNLWINTSGQQDGNSNSKADHQSHLTTGIAQDYVGGEVDMLEPSYMDCLLLSCPSKGKSNAGTIIVVIVVVVVFVVIFIIFLIGLFYCKSKQILFFKPKEKKSKKHANSKSTSSMCKSCEHKHGAVGNSKSPSALTTKKSTVSTNASSQSKSVICVSCQTNFNPENGIELLSTEAIGEQIDDGEEMPPGWIKMKAPSGKLFYYHPAEMKTSWKNPLKGEFDEFNSDW